MQIFYWLTHSLTQSLMHSVKHSRKLATATASLLYRKCSYNFSFDPSLWWPLFPLKVMCSFPHHVRLPALHNNAPQHITMYPDNHRVQKWCIVGMTVGGGMAHEKVYPKLSSGIVHGHLIALVRYKKAQTCLQNDPAYYQQTSAKF